MRFILRELTSMFVAFYAIVLLLHVRSLALGPEAYDAFQAWLASPLSLVLITRNTSRWKTATASSTKPEMYTLRPCTLVATP